MEIDYRMTKQMFDTILDTRSEEEKKLNPYVFVIRYINDNFGLKGRVRHISLFDA